MKELLVAQRYAQALSAAVPDANRLESVLTALNDLASLYEEQHDLRTVLANPTIDLQKRSKVLDEVLRLGDSPVEVQRLMHALLDRRRIAQVCDVASVFATLVDERLNRAEAVVTTALPLGPQQEARLRDALAVFTGKSIRLTTQVDPEIIGGVVASVGGQVIDGSLRTRLDHLKSALISQES